jgi:hypothetical protein
MSLVPALVLRDPDRKRPSDVTHVPPVYASLVRLARFVLL